MITPVIILLRAVLMLALLAAGTVPQGMMRASDGDGMRMVICTDDGPREMLIAADGVVKPAPPQPDSEAEGHGMACLVISQAMPDHDPSCCAAQARRLRETTLVAHHHLLLPPATAPPRAQPRAPPMSV